MFNKESNSLIYKTNEARIKCLCIVHTRFAKTQKGHVRELQVRVLPSPSDPEQTQRTQTSCLIQERVQIEGLQEKVWLGSSLVWIWYHVTLYKRRSSDRGLHYPVSLFLERAVTSSHAGETFTWSSENGRRHHCPLECATHLLIDYDFLQFV